MNKAVFTLETLTCPTCVKMIEDTLGKVNGVNKVKVMFHSARVRTEFDEKVVSGTEIKETIEKLGYPVLSKRVS